MSKRKARKDNNSSKGNSSGKSFTGPLAASSPNSNSNREISNAEVSSSSQSSEEILKDILACKESFSSDVKKQLKEYSRNLEAAVENLMNTKKNKKNEKYDDPSNADFSKIADCKDIKALRKLLKSCMTGDKTESKSRIEYSAPLSPITEELGRSKKSGWDNPVYDEDGIFKRPLGRGKRTLKSIQNDDKFQTPARKKHGYNVAMVTPGPNCSRPVSILRHPNPGEMAISLTGSPLFVAHNNVQYNVPQISIPLSDGRVMTVLANDALDPDMSICSDIDPETCEKLAKLKALLDRKSKRKAGMPSEGNPMKRRT